MGMRVRRVTPRFTWKMLSLCQNQGVAACRTLALEKTSDHAICRSVNTIMSLWTFCCDGCTCNFSLIASSVAATAITAHT